jgi:AcrR family transcriptional regulator
MNKPRGRGRPAGRSTAREDILEVARRRFLAEGYAAVSMRSIAVEAGVDAALISYHFGSKKGLFGAALELAVNPAVVAATAIEAPLETLPEHLLRALLSVWDDPRSSAQLLGLLRGALADQETSRVFREVVEKEIVGRLAERLGGRHAQRRAGAVAVQLGGLVMVRYGLRLEPVASMPAEEVVALLAPAMRLAISPGPPSRPSRTW